MIETFDERVGLDRQAKHAIGSLARWLDEIPALLGPPLVNQADLSALRRWSDRIPADEYILVECDVKASTRGACVGFPLLPAAALHGLPHLVMQAADVLERHVDVVSRVEVTLERETVQRLSFVFSHTGARDVTLDEIASWWPGLSSWLEHARTIASTVPAEAKMVAWGMSEETTPFLTVEYPSLDAARQHVAALDLYAPLAEIPPILPISPLTLTYALNGIPRIDVELLLGEGLQKRWTAQVDELVARGWCAPDAADRLKQWKATLRRFSDHENVLLSRAHSLRLTCGDGAPTVAAALWLQQFRLADEAHFYHDRSPPKNHLEDVRNYFDAVLPSYRDEIDTTFQVCLLRDAEISSARDSNVALARRAGVQAGHRILDAGCGVCGPALDIARAFENVQIDAVTLSPAQAKAACQLVREAGLQDRIRVHERDFHELPFESGTFDVAYFFESSVHAYDPPRLWREMRRLLRPGGRLYIKDCFVPARSLTPSEAEALRSFNRLYVCRTSTVDGLCNVLREAGFADVQSQRLPVNFSRWLGAYRNDDFRDRHAYVYKRMPLYWAEVRARALDPIESSVEP